MFWRNLQDSPVIVIVKVNVTVIVKVSVTVMVNVKVRAAVMVPARGTAPSLPGVLRASVSLLIEQKLSFVDSCRKEKRGTAFAVPPVSKNQSLSQLCQTFCTSSESSSMSMSFSMFFTSPSADRVM